MCVSAEIFRQAEDQKAPQYSSATITAAEIFSDFCEETAAELLRREPTHLLARSLTLSLLVPDITALHRRRRIRRERNRGFASKLLGVVKSNTTLVPGWYLKKQYQFFYSTGSTEHIDVECHVLSVYTSIEKFGDGNWGQSLKLTKSAIIWSKYSKTVKVKYYYNLKLLFNCNI